MKIEPIEIEYCTCVSHVTCECQDNCDECGKHINWNNQPEDVGQFNLGGIILTAEL